MPTDDQQKKEKSLALRLQWPGDPPSEDRVGRMSGEGSDDPESVETRASADQMSPVQDQAEGVPILDVGACDRLRLQVSSLASVVQEVNREVGELRAKTEELAVGLRAVLVTPILDELAALRSEVEALRRRVPVTSARGLTPADLERELDAAFERHGQGGS